MKGAKRPRLSPTTVKIIQRGVDVAMDQYRETARRPDGSDLAGPEADEARADFERFLVYSLARGCPRMRVSFNGCIVCPGPRDEAFERRILLVHPRVMEACGRRTFCTQICVEHEHLFDGVESSQVPDEVLEDALRRIQEEPVRAR